MFHKIAIATDTSKASDKVVQGLGVLRRLGTQEALLIFAVGLSRLHGVASFIVTMVEPDLAKQKEALERQGIATKVAIAPGLPMREVNRLARENGASLIVVGSHGVTCAREVLLGGVALSILQHAELPVLVFRLRPETGKPSQPCEAVSRDFIRNILYATDFSDTAERAFAYVEKMVEAGVKNVTLLHVQDRVKIGKYLKERLEKFNRTDRQRIERLKTRLQELGAADVGIEIPYGSPIQEILKASRREADTLVVMGSQGRGFISEVFLGSVSHGVAMHSGAPLLLIPAARSVG